MSNETIIQHQYRLKGGAEETLKQKNIFLERREPCVVFCADGHTRLKIGDGKLHYKDLPFVGDAPKEYVCNFDNHFQFPNVGSVDVIYKAEKECLLYQWNPETYKYDVLGPTSSEEGAGYDAISGGTAKDLIS